VHDSIADGEVAGEVIQALLVNGHNVALGGVYLEADDEQATVGVGDLLDNRFDLRGGEAIFQFREEEGAVEGASRHIDGFFVSLGIMRHVDRQVFACLASFVGHRVEHAQRDELQDGIAATEGLGVELDEAVMRIEHTVTPWQ